MECNFEKLNLYIDNMLTESEQEEISLHLCGCESCREELAFLESYKKSLCEINQVDLPEKFHQDVLSYIAPSKTKKPFIRIAAGLAAVILVVATGVLGYNFLSDNSFLFSLGSTPPLQKATYEINEDNAYPQEAGMAPGAPPAEQAAVAAPESPAAPAAPAEAYPSEEITSAEDATNDSNNAVAYLSEYDFIELRDELAGVDKLIDSHILHVDDKIIYTIPQEISDEVSHVIASLGLGKFIIAGKITFSILP